eukprot:2639507-Amphidinium_carterae.2
MFPKDLLHTPISKTPNGSTRKKQHPVGHLQVCDKIVSTFLLPLVPSRLPPQQDVASVYDCSNGAG